MNTPGKNIYLPFLSPQPLPVTSPAASKTQPCKIIQPPYTLKYKLKSNTNFFMKNQSWIKKESPFSVILLFLAKPRTQFPRIFWFFISKPYIHDHNNGLKPHTELKTFPTQTQKKSIKNEKKENPFNYWSMLPKIEKKTVYDLIISF